MRTLGLLLAGLLLVGPARADDNPDAKPILDKALKAAGGEDKLAKLQSGTAKGKITFQEGGMDIAIQLDVLWDGPERYRVEAEMNVGGMTRKVMLVLNGDNGWLKHEADTRDAPKEVITLLRNVFHAVRMPHQLAGLRDKDVKLSPLGEMNVGGKAAVGLKVERPNFQSVDIYFDKETGLPVRSEVRVTDPQGKELTLEILYTEYKEIDGLKSPSRVTGKADGKEFQGEVSEVKPVEKPDPGQFAKP